MCQGLCGRSAEAHDCVLEAAWCLTNLAGAEQEVAREVLSAGPLLIPLLGGGWGPIIACQSAWALGECSFLHVWTDTNRMYAPTTLNLQVL